MKLTVSERYNFALSIENTFSRIYVCIIAHKFYLSIDITGSLKVILPRLVPKRKDQRNSPALSQSIFYYLNPKIFDSY